ncbi:MAG: 2Fe-2S iron-sulfur cluster-binding protein [Deltaproteobacteria bacterium]|nr:2Fe-2S iron-sulfur cluster-binding protein [Myxococcales bacterium]MDP3217420.1 2Fe-2S iron-sulfur cluster-binding protein [Deltaproteobacteria bacterium]
MPGRDAVTVRLRFEGREIEARAGASLLQAWLDAGLPLVENVGCMGQGVCGACHVLVRRDGLAGPDEVVRTALACETVVEDGMEVFFVDHASARRPHHYDLRALDDSWTAFDRVPEIFPEAAHCRHCGGCDRACPKGIEVERMVGLASVGRPVEAAALFDECVMCNLCVAACPERIDPSYLGLLVRRLVGSTTLRPADLIARLREIGAGQQRVDVDAEISDEEPRAASVDVARGEGA